MMLQIIKNEIDRYSNDEQEFDDYYLEYIMFIQDNSLDVETMSLRKFNLSPNAVASYIENIYKQGDIHDYFSKDTKTV